MQSAKAEMTDKRFGVCKAAITVLHYVIALLLVLNLNSIYRFLTITSEHFDDFTTIALIVAVAACMILHKITEDQTKKLWKLCLLLLYLAIFLILNPWFPYYYFELAISAFALGLYFFLCNDPNRPQVLIAFRNVVIVISAVSIVLWIFCSMLAIIPPTGTVYTSWSNQGGIVELDSYFGIYFEPQYFWIGDWIFARNSAFFAEAPMASLAFTFALLIDLFVAEQPFVVPSKHTDGCKKILGDAQRSKNPETDQCCVGAKQNEDSLKVRGNHCKAVITIRRIILIIAILTTCSATGILIGVFAVLAKLTMRIDWKKFKTSTSKRQKLGICIGGTCIVLFVAAAAIYIISSKMSETSGPIRLDDYRAGFLAWLDSPIIGNGYMNDYSITAHMADWRGTNYGFSNSILQIFAHGGVYLGILYAAPFVIGAVRCIRDIWRFKNEKDTTISIDSPIDSDHSKEIRHQSIAKLLFLLCTFALLCLAIFTYSYLPIFLLYYFAFSRCQS